jgi:hypothetical protein
MPKLDVRNDCQGVFVSVRTGFIGARKSRLLVTGFASVIAEERQENRPSLPADVEFTIRLFVDIAGPLCGGVRLEFSDVEGPPVPAGGCG